MLYALLVIGKSNIKVLHGPVGGGVLVFESEEEALQFGKDLYGDENPHVSTKAVAVGSNFQGDFTK